MAQEESREELLALWAKLLAAACDPARSNRVRRGFIEVVKELDPADAIVLRRLRTGTPQRSVGDARPKWMVLAAELGLEEDEVVVSLNHLAKLGCLESHRTLEVPQLSPLGRELLRALD